MRYLVECYLPLEEDAGEAAAARARAAATELAAGGARVRYLRSMFVPRDEMCFVVYEADSAEIALEAGRRAALRCDRALELVEGPDGDRVDGQPTYEESP